MDRAGNVYIAGSTGGQQFPATPGALVTEKDPNNYTGSLAKLSPAGVLLAATYLGFSNTTAYSIAVDPCE